MTPLSLRRLEVGLAAIPPDLWRDYAVPILTALRASREALRQAKRQHLIVEEDCWYSCPRALQDDGTSACCTESAEADAATGRCTCGADKHNAAIDAVLATCED